MTESPETNVAPNTVRGQGAEFQALQAVIGALQPLDAEARQRILVSAATFLQAQFQAPDGPPRERIPVPGTRPTATPPYSDSVTMSPKEFLLEKQPRTDVERIACLAYYLTHYEDTPSFRTLDLSKLNIRAAQPKFTNAAQAAKNAVTSRYIVASTKRGHRQLGAAGEQFVRALPDRNAARSAMAAAQPKRRQRRQKATDERKGQGDPS